VADVPHYVLTLRLKIGLFIAQLLRIVNLQKKFTEITIKSDSICFQA